MISEVLTAAAGMTDEAREDDAALLTPLLMVMAICLLAAAGVTLLLCHLLLRHRLGWVELGLIAAGLVCASVQVHAGALWILAKGAHEHLEASPRQLIVGSWAVAAWLPVLILLAREHSLWMAVLAPWMTALITCLLMRLRRAPAEVGRDDVGYLAAAGAPQELTFFQFGLSATMLRNAVPVAATSLVWQCGLAAFAAGSTPTAALLFSSGAVFPAAYRGRNIYRDPGMLRPVRASALLVLAIVAAAAALMPMALHPGAASRAGRLLGIPDAESAMPETATAHRNNHYSGVILTMPPQHLRNLVAPPLDAILHNSHSTATPAVIPFDGAYWYFQPPDDRPGSDALTLRGDPNRVNVRPTDEYPMTMEAHQQLSQPIRFACCRAIRVDMRSAEHGEGAIYVGLTLRDTRDRRETVYALDNQLLPSTLDSRLEQHPEAAGQMVEESLSFPLPRVARGTEFNELIVSIRRVRSRTLNGVHIAVKQFALER
jgi:hypothetical protein